MSIVMDEMAKQLWRWDHIASALRFAHVTLAIIGIACPLVVSTFADKLSPTRIKLISLAGALAIGVFAAFEVGARANQFRGAWKILNEAQLLHRAGLIDEKAVLEAYAKGEALVDVTKADPFPPPGTKSAPSEATATVAPASQASPR